MKISELLQSGTVNCSCEIFPPKDSLGIDQVKQVARDIAALNPSYMSVTYGASGGRGLHTAEIARAVKSFGITPLAHLTCVTNTRAEVAGILAELKESGIENVLALRGDIPEDLTFPAPGQYHYASELIGDIRSRGAFCIGAACYPEGHPESPSKHADMDRLYEKAEAGTDFLITQLFFDNNILYNFLYRALQRGIRVPVAAGIMPVCSGKQIKRICALSGASLPPRFAAIVDRFGRDPAAMRQAGIAFATEQIIDLIANGVYNIHLYTMNKPDVAGAIFSNLSGIIGKPI
jgi:methylenetetrahydrofolate reductase (NADPH)